MIFLLATLGPQPAQAQAGDESLLPEVLADHLRQYGVEAVDGSALRIGAEIRFEGTVRLTRWTLGDAHATHRDSVAHARGIAIERAGAHIAYCESPRDELAAHASQTGIISGILACEAAGAPCNAQTTGKLAQLEFHEDEPVLVLSECAWEPVPVALPESLRRDLEAAGMRPAEDGRPLTLGTAVIGAGRVWRRHLQLAVQLGDGGPIVRCETSEAPELEQGSAVTIAGALHCEPGLGQGCSAAAEAVPFHGPVIRPSGPVEARALLKACVLQPTKTEGDGSRR